MDIIKTREAAEIMGITTDLLKKRMDSFDEFPKPVKRTNHGFYFDKYEILNYEHTHKIKVNKNRESPLKKLNFSPWGIDKNRIEFVKTPLTLEQKRINALLKENSKSAKTELVQIYQENCFY